MSKQHRDVNFFILYIVLILALFANPVRAAGFEPVEHLTTITKNFLLKNIAADSDETVVVKVNPVNAAELPICSSEIEPSVPTNTNIEQATGVELSCNGAIPWRILIPVDIAINISVVVAKDSIMPKDAITEDDLTFAIYDKNHLYNSFFKNKQDVVGLVAVHMITPGTVLTKKNLQEPTIVFRNQNVTLIDHAKGIAVSMQGIAKSDGSINTTIKVYNPASKRTMDATVVGPNKAEIVS